LSWIVARFFLCGCSQLINSQWCPLGEFLKRNGLVDCVDIEKQDWLFKEMDFDFMIYKLK
jgi:hypothetical protein